MSGRHRSTKSRTTESEDKRHTHNGDGGLYHKYPKIEREVPNLPPNEQAKKLAWAFWCFMSRDSRTKDWKPRMERDGNEPLNRMDWLCSESDSDNMRSRDEMKKKRALADIQEKIDRVMLPPDFIGRVVGYAVRGTPCNLNLGYPLKAAYLAIEGLDHPRDWRVQDVTKNPSFWAQEVQDAYLKWVKSEDGDAFSNKYPGAKNTRNLSDAWLEYHTPWKAEIPRFNPRSQK